MGGKEGVVKIMSECSESLRFGKHCCKEQILFKYLPLLSLVTQ